MNDNQMMELDDNKSLVEKMSIRLVNEIGKQYLPENLGAIKWFVTAAAINNNGE